MTQQSVFPIDLSTAGSQTIKQFSGVLRIIQMADSAGALDLTGVINVRTGHTKGPLIPLRMNNAIMGEAERDLVLSWAAQSGVIATILITPNVNTFDVDADPPVQLVTGSLASTFTADNIDVLTTATLIAAANTSRQSITIWNNGAEDIFLGGSGVTIATGLLLSSGAGITFDKTTAALYGISTSVTCDTRYLEEG